jgi:hypothetical protein
MDMRNANKILIGDLKGSDEILLKEIRLQRVD